MNVQQYDTTTPLTGHVLIVTQDGREVQRIEAQREVVSIGRSNLNDVVLDEYRVSRHHAQLEYHDAVWYITDLDSTNGSFLEALRLEPNRRYPWLGDQLLRVGAFELKWAPRLDDSAYKTQIWSFEPVVQRDQAERPRTPGSLGLRVTLRPAQVTVGLGEEAAAELVVANEGNHPQVIELQLSGLPASWYTLAQTRLTLSARRQETVRLALHPPADGSDLQARETAYSVKVLTSADQEMRAYAAGKLALRVHQEFSVRVEPVEIESGDPCTVVLENLGEAPERFTVYATDPAALLQLEMMRGQLRVPPGTATEIPLTVHWRGKRPFFGRIRHYSFDVHARARVGQPKTTTALLRVRPRVPTWAVWLAATGTAALVTLVSLLG